MPTVLATTVIGSYPQPDWLVDRDRLRGSLPPRVRARELWRVEERYLAQAQDDATALAIAEQERAGVDIVTDGEIRRESYSNRFATALDGVDVDNPAMVPGRAGGTNAVPRVVGKVRRTRPVEVDDLRFLRARTGRTVKITLPGPFTMSQQAYDEAYADEAELAMDLAAAVNEEVHDLFAAGADVVQIDEPWLDVSLLEPISGKTVVLGVLDLGDPVAETPEQVAARIDAALAVVPPERLQVGPDCGMKYLTRDLAFAKLRALVEGARIVRERL